MLSDADLVSPAHFARARLGFDPDPLQEQALESIHSRGILLTTRQWGKSTMTAAKVVHRAFTQEEALILVVSPCGRQSAEFVNKVRHFVRRLGIVPRGESAHEISVLLPNGSRIIGLPGVEGNIRGFSAPRLVVIDEAALVPDEVMMALGPMLATSNGDLWMLSTPRGKRGFFYRTWEEADPDCCRIRVPATACPRIPPEFLEREKKRMTESWFLQEYLCEFTQADDSLYDSELLRSSLSRDIEPIFGRDW